MELNRQLRRSLPCTSLAPYLARRAIDLLSDSLDAEVFSDFRLLVNELVTNTVRHSHARPSGDITLTVLVGDGRVRAEVWDPGPWFSPPFDNPGLLSESNRGLFLVDALSDNWGIEKDRGKTVWFELIMNEARI